VKVAYGIKGKYVIAWYCGAAAASKPNAPVAAQVGPPVVAASNTYAQNVGKKCITDTIDTCFNEKQKLEHNN